MPAHVQNPSISGLQHLGYLIYTLCQLVAFGTQFCCKTRLMQLILFQIKQRAEQCSVFQVDFVGHAQNPHFKRGLPKGEAARAAAPLRNQRLETKLEKLEL